jgi:hypothetical protein
LSLVMQTCFGTSRDVVSNGRCSIATIGVAVPIVTGVVRLLALCALVEVLTNNLNLDIDLNETFTERIDLNKTWVDCTIESPEFGDQANITLRNRFVWVGTADTARERAHCADT